MSKEPARHLGAAPRRHTGAMPDTPVPLSRRLQPPVADDGAQPWSPARKFALMIGIAAAALGTAAVLALRWFDDTSARDQVQVLQTLPQPDASKTATTSAVTYPFAKDGSSSADGAVLTAPTTAAPERVTPAKAARPVPPGLTAQQWQALVNDLTAKPDGAREIARLETWFRFADTVRQFRDLNRAALGEPTPALVALAKQIDSELDVHVAQRELSGTEAHDIKATLLEVLEPDADTADETLERWARTLPRERTDAAPSSTVRR